jgi:hypothetical protein
MPAARPPSPPPCVGFIARAARAAASLSSYEEPSRASPEPRARVAAAARRASTPPPSRATPRTEQASPPADAPRPPTVAPPAHPLRAATLADRAESLEAPPGDRRGLGPRGPPSQRSALPRTTSPDASEGGARRATCAPASGWGWHEQWGARRLGRADTFGQGSPRSGRVQVTKIDESSFLGGDIGSRHRLKTPGLVRDP